MSENKKWINQLYYGDNLEILGKYIPDESVDLIYLDPPFNSNANYNVLFKSPSGNESPAQIAAFEDTWHWDDSISGKAIKQVQDSEHQDVAKMLLAMRNFLGKNDMTAYLAMMAVRLIELHRVLKPTGSLYLHCDPTASHYLKLLLDVVFGVKNYRNEIIWGYRTGGISKKWFARKHDTILSYSKDEKQCFFSPQKYKSYQKKKYNYSKEYPEHWDDKEKKWYHLSYCRDVWEDIDSLGTGNKKRLGYPTQKPVALLERIITAASKKGDVVLDPFCGCGTTIQAAEKLGRRWIGIDITSVAITLIEARLYDFFKSEYRDAYHKRPKFDVIGLPKDIDGARDFHRRDGNLKKEFEKWACSLIKAYPNRGGKKGADGGVDGLFWFGLDGEYKAIVSVKGGGVGEGMVRDLSDVVREQNADIGVFLTLKKPTKGMIKWANKSGIFQTKSHGEAPRIQIITIEEALKKRERAVDTVLPRGVAYKQAKQEEISPTIKDMQELMDD